ncbi:MAG: hypothetical protein WC465_00050 [Patescibacteria group bacterium]
MKAFIVWLIIIILFFAVLFRYLDSRSRLAGFNDIINNFINNRPKISCVEDADCHLTQIDCSPCSCGFAANRAWQPYCPFQKKQVLCEPCEQFPKEENIKCINTECQIVY